MTISKGCWEISKWFIEPLNIVDEPPLNEFLNKLYWQYIGDNSVDTVKKNIVEKFKERKTFFKIFLSHSFNFFTLASNFPTFLRLSCITFKLSHFFIQTIFLAPLNLKVILLFRWNLASKAS